jgi:hypothetical protein
MAARRANQIFATVGLFAVLVAARMAVETFPVARAEHAISALMQGPRSNPTREAAPAEAPEIAEAAPADPSASDPVGVLAEAPGPARKMPVRPSRALHGGAGVRIIRVPSLDS